MRLALITMLVACGAKPPKPGWVERDGLGGSTRDPTPVLPTEVATPTVDVSRIDVSKLDDAAIDELDEATARALLDRVGDARPAGRIALRAARLAWHRGDGALARALLARTATAADRDTVSADAAELGKQLVVAPIAPTVIAVLLPLTGKYAAIGSELKVAVQLAPASGTTWLFLDTKGDPDGAVAAVEQAAAKGAVAILGPVGQKEALAAARAATLRAIPIGLLAPADGADPGAGVFRLVGSPADEGRAVAQLAHSEGFPTVAVFAPRDDVGGESANAFVAEAKRLGLQVTSEGSYDPTGGNLEPDVKEFLNLNPTKNPALADHLARKGKKGWATFSPAIEYSLLYIPDRYDRASLVAAFLPYYNVELRTTEFPDPDKLKRKHGGVMPQVVQLVGGAGWHHPSLPIRGGAAVQGALIVEAFAAEAAGDVGTAFSAAFQSRTNRQASSAAAETYDAATLIAKLRQQVGNAPDIRGSLRAALARGKLDDGACGPAAIGPDGELTRDAAVLEVQGDQLVAAP